MALSRHPTRVSRVDLVNRVTTTQSVSNYLMCTSYDPTDQLYTLADLSLGVALEITPLAASVLSDDELTTYSDAVATALSRLPEHALVQTLIVPAMNVDAEIADFQAQGGDPHPVLSTHERMVADQFRRSVARPLFAFQFGEGGFKTKRYRILLLIVLRPDAQVGGAKASLSDFIATLWDRMPHQGRGRAVQRGRAEERYLGMRARLAKRLQECARRLEGTLRTNHLPSRRLEPAELIGLSRMMLWPDGALTHRSHWDTTQQIATQLPIGDIAVECASGSVLSDRWVFKTLSMSGVPRATSPGTLTLPNQSLGFFTLLDFIGDGFVTIAGHCKPLADMRTFIEKRTTFVKGGFAIPAKVDQLLTDCDLASFYLETDRRRMFDTQLTLVVRARSEREAQERAEKIRDKAADIGVDCRIENHYAPSALFQALPFGFSPTIPEARRLFILPDRGLADFMPLFMLSRGTRRAGMLLHNRLGEPFFLDPFDSPTAAHMVICGESGSGKSFFTNYLIFSLGRRPQSQVFAIDKGRSYATATSILGQAGAYHNLGLTAKTCINAFAGTLGSSAAFLRKFIAHLASQVPSDRLTSEQLGIVDACITRAFTRKQLATTWLRFQDIATAYPRGTWIDRCRKRLVIEPLDELQRSAIEQLKTRDAGRTPEFEIYTRAWLHGRSHGGAACGSSSSMAGTAGTAAAGDAAQHGAHERVREPDEVFSDSRSINQETAAWLVSRGFLLEDHTLPDPDCGQAPRRQACVLYLTATQERTLAIDGFAFTPLRDALVLEAARREDVQDLHDAGVVVRLPEDYRMACRARLEHELGESHPRASREVIAELLAARLAELDPVAYFDTVTGSVRLQFEVYFSDFIRELTAHPDQERAGPIHSRLSAYHGTGALAGFFDGETQFDLNDRKLVTFELQELSSAGEHLVAAVVGTLLQMLILYCQGESRPDGGPRSYVKYIILDEFWALLAVPMVAELVITGLRTLRKHNTAIICISQLVRDFTSSEQGRVVLSGAQHRVLLRQPPDVIAELDRLLSWSAEQQGLMYSVVSAKGLFSEALIDIPNQGISEVARFVPTPYAYWIFTTAPEDVKQRDRARNELRAAGHHADVALDLALRACAERWPNGFSAGEARTTGVS